MQIFNFNLNNITEGDNQEDYLMLLLNQFKNLNLPLLKYKELYTSLNSFYSNSILIKNKTPLYWQSIFQLFLLLIKANSEIINSDVDMELIWSLFIRKFLISYVDSKKNLTISGENDPELVLKVLISYVKNQSNFFFIQ